MQREIKFRGKRVDNGEWVYGLPVNYCNKTYILVLTGFEEERVYEQYPHKEMWPYEVITETVGQYTGLKDKNGNEIYEGDIVEYEDYSGGMYIFKEQPKGRGVIKINNLLNGIYLKGLGTFEGNKVEVINKIYDNPELLEVSE